MVKKIISVTSSILFVGVMALGVTSADKNTNNYKKFNLEEPTTYDVSSYYGGYYSSITSWTDGEDLKNQLNTRIRNGYTALDYNWDVNKKADQALDDFESVDVIYSSSNYLQSETVTNNYGWNREHCFCASLMTGKSTSDATKIKGRATDYHNLIASDYSGNSSRGNKNYGVANSTDKNYKDYTTDEGADGYLYDTKNFEPSNKDKGRVARAIFYMATMYKDDETEGSASYKGLTIQEEYVDYDKNTYSAFAIGNLSTLLSWNDFGVDRSEYQHNESVYTTKIDGKAQGNRNPFVDYPELVDYVYGSKKDQPGELKYLKPSYENLEISSSVFSNYAIKQAKRDYYVDDSISLDDYEIVKVKKDFTTEPYEVASYTYNSFSSSDLGRYKTSLYVNEEVSIPLVLKITDGSLDKCPYVISKMSPSSGGVLNSIKDSPGVDNVVTLNGIKWIVNYEKGKIVGLNSTWGTQFGTTTTPVNKLTFQTVDDFSFNDINAVNAIYARLNSGSGSSYDVKFYIGDEEVYSSKVEYYLECSQLYGYKLEEAKQGKVKIVLSNVTSKACYVDAIGINGIHIDPVEPEPTDPTDPIDPITPIDPVEPEPNKTDNKKSKNNTGLIIGLSVGGAILVIAIIVILIIFVF